MGADRFNKEGYHDPTAEEAITNVVKENEATVFMPLVYICSPYAGDVARNVDRAKVYSKFALVKKYIPLAPHLLYPQFMDDSNPKERSVARLINYVLLTKCRELWVFGDEISPGMAYEISIAEKRGLVINYFDEGCREVNKNA